MVCPQCGQPTAEGESRCPACGSELAPTHDDEPPDEVAEAVHVPAGVVGYAGFWRRVVATFIDAAILAVVAWLLGLLPAVTGTTGLDMASVTGRAAAVAAGLVLTWVYFAGLESSAWQGTLGKRAIGLRVTDTSGSRIGFGRASGRVAGKLVSSLLLGVGFLMAAFTTRRQALHDLLANSLVVR